MPATTIRDHFALNDGPLVDEWLRFAAPIQARYDSEHAAERSAAIRRAIVAGTVLYNVYNFTSIVLLADILLLSVTLRIAVVTPLSFALAWLAGSVSPRWSERALLLGTLNAYVVPVLLFWLTRDPLGLFTCGELPLTIVFVNMVLALRFRHAALFTAGAFAATVLAVMTKHGLSGPLRFVFIVQIATACLVTLYGNYRIERRRCQDYLAALGATLEAGSADAARRKFQDMSRTDALTGLPNRRHLTKRLDTWLAAPDPVALMMIDIDCFKLFNDSLGHLAGDDCLRRVADVFAEAGAEADSFCARFGGEEFTFLLRGASAMEAARRAKSLLQAVAALEIRHPGRPDGFGIVTVSIGVAIRPDDPAATPADLIAAADRALYLAKTRGRNRFVLDEGGADPAAGGTARSRDRLLDHA